MLVSPGRRWSPEMTFQRLFTSLITPVQLGLHMFTWQGRHRHRDNCRFFFPVKTSPKIMFLWALMKNRCAWAGVCKINYLSTLAGKCSQRWVILIICTSRFSHGVTWFWLLLIEHWEVFCQRTASTTTRREDALGRQKDALQKLGTVLRDRGTPPATKKSVLNWCVIFVLIYRSECWAVSSKMKKILEADGSTEGC